MGPPRFPDDHLSEDHYHPAYMELNDDLIHLANSVNVVIKLRYYKTVLVSDHISFKQPNPTSDNAKTSFEKKKRSQNSSKINIPLPLHPFSVSPKYPGSQ